MKQKKSEEVKKKNNKIAAKGCFGLLALFLIVIIASVIWPTDHFKADKTSQAYVVSKHIVKNQLEYPEGAEFPMLPVLSEIQEGTDSIYRVVGDVTVKNAGGTTETHRYNCRMKYKGGDPINPSSWEVVDFSL